MLEVSIYTAKGHPAKNILAGAIQFDESGGLRGKAQDSAYDRLIKNILKSAIMVGRDRIDPASNPLNWISNLHKEYKSYALRATEPVESADFSYADGTLTKSEERAFDGTQAEITTEWSKLETGAQGEQIGIAYLKAQGYDDAAKFASSTRTNLPVDIIHDHVVYEIKAGLVSNGPSAQKWRLTIGEPGDKEKEWLQTATDTDKAKWNKKKDRMIVMRKRKLVSELSKQLGNPIKLKTMAMIINPDTKLVDIYEFEGVHPIIRWRGEVAKAGYKGSFKF